jgi:hypothetical protein
MPCVRGLKLDGQIYNPNWKSMGEQDTPMLKEELYRRSADMLAILIVYCSYLSDPIDVAQCVVDLHTCAVEAVSEYPDRSYEDRVDNCAESLPYVGVEE